MIIFFVPGIAGMQSPSLECAPAASIDVATGHFGLVSWVKEWA